MAHALALGAITWDPFIRGVLIVAVAFIVLPGSVYLLLATNTGARLGFLLAAAGLTGWIFVMAIVWAVFGIGDAGRVPSWKTSEIITGNISQSTTLTDFPKGFKEIPPTDPEFSDVSSAADKALTAGAGRFTAPFSAATDYVQISHWRHDPTTVWHIRHHKITPFGHAKHIDVVQVQPVLPAPDTGGAPPAPTPDKSKPITTVVLVRDLGSLRQPPIVIAIASGLVFLVVCYVLHTRDKEIMAARAAETGGSRERELVGAGRG
jgi:hypothetical protein